eukprot:g56087.t1
MEGIGGVSEVMTMRHRRGMGGVKEGYGRVWEVMTMSRRISTEKERDGDDAGGDDDSGAMRWEVMTMSRRTSTEKERDCDDVDGDDDSGAICSRDTASDSTSMREVGLVADTEEGPVVDLWTTAADLVTTAVGSGTTGFGFICDFNIASKTFWIDASVKGFSGGASLPGVLPGVFSSSSNSSSSSSSGITTFGFPFDCPFLEGAFELFTGLDLG